MLIPTQGDDWFSPPQAAMDILLFVFFTILAMILIVSGWKAIRTGEVTLEGTTVNGWWAYVMGTIYLFLGVGITLVCVLTLVGRFL